jgi:ABC-type nitrate/sulfonate/bicarbonate transport system substrate-binding protein
MPALEAYQRGADTVMIASSMNQLEHAVMGEKSITSVDQLKGKVLGISALGALTDIILREALRYHGISEKEVTIIPVGDEGARLSSLQTGRVQAVIISGIQRRTAARLGFRQVIDFAKLPIEVSGSSIQARRSYLAQNPKSPLNFSKPGSKAASCSRASPNLVSACRRNTSPIATRKY